MAKYSQEIRQFISDNYRGVGPKDMAELLNKTYGTSYTKSQMKGYYGNNNINSGVTGYFQKGGVSHNKGKKGYYTPGSEKGWFKKGQEPVNHKPVGSERVDVDGYTLIKTAEPNVWELKHKVIWTEKNGPVPNGHVLTFLDGDKSNIVIENIKLITMNESMVLNQKKLRSSIPEYTEIGILIAKVKIAADHRKKSQGNP